MRVKQIALALYTQCLAFPDAHGRLPDLVSVVLVVT